MTGSLLVIFLKGNKACKRCYESTRTADIYTEQELSVVFRKLREQYCRGNVAYKLAGKRGKYESIHIKKRGEEASYRIYSRHISGEYKEEKECEKKTVIHL